jgi:hypothetical protein
MWLPLALTILALSAAFLSASPAMAQAPTGVELDEAARMLVSRYSARTILRDAELDVAQASALTADWPTDTKLGMALSAVSGKQLEQQIGALTTHLPALSARLTNALFLESWLRNRVA